jgi:hypothetical protein
MSNGRYCGMHHVHACRQEMAELSIQAVVRLLDRCSAGPVVGDRCDVTVHRDIMLYAHDNENWKQVPTALITCLSTRRFACCSRGGLGVLILALTARRQSRRREADASAASSSTRALLERVTLSEFAASPESRQLSHVDVWCSTVVGRHACAHEPVVTTPSSY